MRHVDPIDLGKKILFSWEMRTCSIGREAGSSSLASSSSSGEALMRLFDLKSYLVLLGAQGQVQVQWEQLLKK